ncbi:unnamed protein product [Ambrosiozyma monospora]|uniref:Unnamed protein product n=1 Tax=Ambrosiozyma monospora TaxID=43982 RepID=A0A9W7DMW1_AMBMO|nr:unnamed protein product [Ambrosiozyma monospora]
MIQRGVNKLLDYLLTQNEDLKSANHQATKNYSLILNKNGRLDIISFPKTSNLQLMPKDLIIIEGDRGKDLVMVLKPVIDFRFALFFNYLKKKLHLKSLEFGNANPSTSAPQQSQQNQQHNHAQPTLGLGHLQPQALQQIPQQPAPSQTPQQQKSIINEDENFITLPNKQILRFAKPHELTQLTSKYNDELMALRICLNYAASLNLDLIIKNVEFQFDKKKLIIYYYCLQRLDFRGLIKELFKIYKTRIWLCAILLIEKTYKPLLDYETEKIAGLKTPPSSRSSRSNDWVVIDNLPAKDQIYQLSEIEQPAFFHSKIFFSLIEMFKYEITNPQIFKDRYSFLNDASSSATSASVIPDSSSANTTASSVGH